MRVITIDFWNTLFDASNSDARNAERLAALAQGLEGEGVRVESERLGQAFRDLWIYFDHHWLKHQRTPTSLEMVQELCSTLKSPLSERATKDIAEVFERGVLHHPPKLLPGVVESLEGLASRARLALISDTAFSPGRVLRELMDRVGIARHFSAFVFSDETGVAKPHPEAFRQAFRLLGLDDARDNGLHIGDIERTDIAGARGAGMKTILYCGDPGRLPSDDRETAADAVVDHWESMIEAIDRVWI